MKQLKNSKVTFCPGPGAIIPEWFKNQSEFFGRGDKEYDNIKHRTLNWLKKKSGQDEIVPVAGAATTAAIVAINSFLKGRVLVINTGYYSNRWLNYLKNSKIKNKVVSLDYALFLKKKEFKKIDWIVFTYVETASCTKFDLEKIKKKAKKNSCKLFLDATASIGLEKNHHLADVLIFSSCKGLFGPTGLGFIGYKKKIKPKVTPKDFLFNYLNHKEGKYTLGYNCIASLYSISKNHSRYLKKINFAQKKLKKFNVSNNSPKIGLGLKYKIRNKKINKTIFYIPRENPGYDVIFLLGLIKFKNSEIIKILKSRIIDNFI